MEAIILAGGLGTRLAARLSDVPKAMAPVAGRPFLEILLRQLQHSGCSRVLLSVGHLHHVIKEHFSASINGMELEYSVETTPLGTGGAIRNTMGLVHEDMVLVLNGDTFLDADYARMLSFHRSQGAAMTMAIRREADIARYGGVLVSGKQIVGFEEKGRSGPGWINAGAYVLDKNFLWPPGLARKFSFEKELLAPHIAQIAPAAFEVEGFFIDIGVPEDYDRAQTALASF
jgi:D-glycero-alpha-D-manno-heptose 1-phosphate guanylyltransferase